MTEWLGKQILDGFHLRQFQTKAGGTSTGAQAQEGTIQRNAKELDLTVLKLRVLLTFSV